MRVRQSWAVLALAAATALTGCADDEPAIPAPPVTSAPDAVPGGQPAVLAQTASRSTPAVSGGDALVLHPRRPSGRLVVYVHGATEVATSIATDPLKGPVVAGLLAAGYTVAAADAGGDAWGGPGSVATYQELAAAVPHQALYVLGQSMGGLAAMQLPDVVDVRAMALVYPVCDLASMLSGTYAAAISTTWGADLERASAALSPVAPQRPTPMRIWSSPGDTVVPRDQNTLACAALAGTRGSAVELTETTGDHGDPSNFDPAGVLALFASH